MVCSYRRGNYDVTRIRRSVKIAAVILRRFSKGSCLRNCCLADFDRCWKNNLLDGVVAEGDVEKWEESGACS